MSVCDHHDAYYAAMLDRIYAYREEEELLAKKQDRTPLHPSLPSNFSVDMGNFRMRVEFEPIAS